MYHGQIIHGANCRRCLLLKPYFASARMTARQRARLFPVDDSVFHSVWMKTGSSSGGESAAFVAMSLLHRRHSRRSFFAVSQNCLWTCVSFVDPSQESGLRTRDVTSPAPGEDRPWRTRAQRSILIVFKNNRYRFNCQSSIPL